MSPALQGCAMVPMERGVHQGIISTIPKVDHPSNKETFS